MGDPARKHKTPSLKQLEYLRSCGLPDDYMELSARPQRKARMASLCSWYDPDPSRSHILCNDVEAFVKALRLYVEFYRKPCDYLAGVYHFADPDYKYDIVRAMMSPPKIANLPSKTVITAARGTTKTITMREMIEMICLTKTVRTQCLLSEVNADRTAEEIRNISSHIENNPQIHSDFGGEGVLWPTGRITNERWNEKRLEFRNRKCSIVGVSTGSKQRGRHPTFGAIDDPDDGEVSRNREWRRAFFSWLVRTYIPMFGPGSQIAIIQTVTHAFCPILVIMGKKTSVQEDEYEFDGLESAQRDTRFDDWHKHNFELFTTGDDGNLVSHFPDKHPPEDFERLMGTLGPQAAMAEYQGRIVPEGFACWKRDQFQHGYMHTRDGEFVDLHTGKREPWSSWLATLRIVAGVDLANSLDPDACMSAIITIGIDNDGTAFVLDAWTRRVRAETAVRESFRLCEEWKARLLGVEQVAMQSVMVRYAYRIAAEMRERGVEAPAVRGIKRSTREKYRRIIAGISPLMYERKIRFLSFASYADENGVTLEPEHNKHYGYWIELLEQVDTMTDLGPSGGADAIDALDMALYIAGRLQPVEDAPDGEENDAQLDKWRELGMSWSRLDVPRECWTQKMVDEEKESLDAVVAGEVVDPYDI